MDTDKKKTAKTRHGTPHMLPMDLPAHWLSLALAIVKLRRPSKTQGKQTIASLHYCANALRKALNWQSKLGGRMCVHCGCTDSRACKGGCYWAIKHKATNTGVCSQCFGKETRIVG